LKDPASKLLAGNTNAKSDVANKLISMFLHELSRLVSKAFNLKVNSKEYAQIVRESFENLCPYCSRTLTLDNSVVEHLDGMNRLRAGLHVPGNVLVACKECNNRKRTDDSRATHLLLAPSGWASFLSHDGTRCVSKCRTCEYWRRVWPDEMERRDGLSSSRARIQAFRNRFAETSSAPSALATTLPSKLVDLYSNCQSFAEAQIEALLKEVHGDPTLSRARSRPSESIEGPPR
jgi:hypothetical protein